MELLALRWCDIEFEAGELRIRHQLSRKGELVKLKTNAGKRDVILMPELAALLKRHRLASRHSGPAEFVFCGANGTREIARHVEHRGPPASEKSVRHLPHDRVERLLADVDPAGKQQ